MPADRKRLPAIFYRTKAGSEPVREWLKSPLCRNLGHGVWEVRTQLRDRTARVLFCTFEEHMVHLHGFIKKTRKTPAADLDLARQRKRELENG